MKKQLLLFSGVVLGAAMLVAAEAAKHSFKPKDGYVPDSKTAVKIAVAVWEPIYGEEQIAKERPYRATLTNVIWTVSGSLAPSMIGGVAVAEMAKDDGRILRVSHGQ